MRRSILKPLHYCYQSCRLEPVTGACLVFSSSRFFGVSRRLDPFPTRKIHFVDVDHFGKTSVATVEHEPPQLKSLPPNCIQVFLLQRLLLSINTLIHLFFLPKTLLPVISGVKVSRNGDETAHIAWNFFLIVTVGCILKRSWWGVAIKLKSEQDESEERQYAGKSISLHGNIIHEVK